MSFRFTFIFLFFFFNDTATTEIYTLSLHDALPISGIDLEETGAVEAAGQAVLGSLDREFLVARTHEGLDRKSTRLNSSHVRISYAVFCLKKKKKKTNKENNSKTIILHTNKH